MAVVFFKDKRKVKTLTTKYNVSKSDMVDVARKCPDQPPVKKPNAVINYTKHMGGVDHSDLLSSCHQFMRRTKKWY